MSKYDDSFGQKRLLIPQQKRYRDKFVVINHDWFIPIQSLRRLNHENELESLIFPSNESFDSQWQLFIDCKTHPERLRFGLVLLSPLNRCLRADIKIMLVKTLNEQIIKEHLIENHLFFLTKGEPLNSFITERISSKVYIDFDDLIDIVDCSMIVNVKFRSELEIEPKTKRFDFSRKLTINWKLDKYKKRRLISDRFQFTHTKIIEGIRSKHYKLSIHYSRTNTSTKQIPFIITVQCLNPTQFNYGKFEIICPNEHNILRRYIESMEDLTDNYSIEFFSLDELLMNIYKYKQNFQEINGRFVIIDYILISIRIIQPLNPSDVFRKIKHTVEPTIISLNPIIKKKQIQNDKRARSIIKSPISQQNLRTTSWEDTRIVKTNNPIFPPIRTQTRLRSSISLRTLPNISENSSSRSFMYKSVRITKQSSTLPSASTTTNSIDQTDNFTFLNNLYRSGLHSDIIIRCQNQQWNLHKSILSARSIYFNQYFSQSNELELILTDNNTSVLERLFRFIYTNEFISDKQTKNLIQLSLKYGIDTLTLLCLQDLCNPQNINIQTAAYILIILHQSITDSYEKYHSNDYINQIKIFKQNILRFIQFHSRDVLLSNQWKILEKQYPNLVHDVLEFVIFEKIDE